MNSAATWTGIFSGVAIFLAASIISVVPVVFVLARLPATYFQEGHRPSFDVTGSHPGMRRLAWLGRNILGLILIVFGVLLSLPGIPGQGLLTILIGVTLLDIPGKRRLERKLVGRPQVLKTINWLRRRFGKPPLILENKLEQEAGIT